MTAPAWTPRKHIMRTSQVGDTCAAILIVYGRIGGFSGHNLVEREVFPRYTFGIL